MQPEFDTIWNVAKNIPGYFYEEEAVLMYEAALKAGKNANVVEIGTYCGRSSYVLLSVAKYLNQNVTFIDNFVRPIDDLAFSVGIPFKKVTSVKKEFLSNMDSVGHPYILCDESSIPVAQRYRMPIDLIFIDGDHSEKGVSADYRLWVPKVKSGGTIVFHDWDETDPFYDGKPNPICRHVWEMEKEKIIKLGLQCYQSRYATKL